MAHHVAASNWWAARGVRVWRSLGETSLRNCDSKGDIVRDERLHSCCRLNRRELSLKAKAIQGIAPNAGGCDVSAWALRDREDLHIASPEECRGA